MEQPTMTLMMITEGARLAYAVCLGATIIPIVWFSPYRGICVSSRASFARKQMTRESMRAGVAVPDQEVLSMQGFFIPGPLPGLNEMLDWAKRQGVQLGKRGRRWNLYAENKRMWEDVIILEIKQAKIKPGTGSVTINYLWRELNKRRDPSNIAAGRKFVEDALVRAGILPNDGWKEIAGFTDSFVVDKKCPGVLVTFG